MPVCEWINCLTGRRGKISLFPAEILSSDGAPGISLRFSSDDGNIRICPDFRAGKVFLDGKLLSIPTAMESDVPVILRMGKMLLVLCVASSGEWAEEYRFPLWTLFEAETFEPIETVRAPADFFGVLERHKLRADECCVSPYGLPAAVELASVIDLFR